MTEITINQHTYKARAVEDDRDALMTGAKGLVELTGAGPLNGAQIATQGGWGRWSGTIPKRGASHWPERLPQATKDALAALV